MKAMLMTAAGGPQVLQPADIPIPEPGASDLLVRVHAAGINPLDTKVRAHHMFHPKSLPAILGCDGAGTVESVGAQVRRFKPGDAVYFFNNGLGGAPGSYAEYTLVDEHCAAAKPANISMLQAAAAPLVLITAWEALVDRVRLGAGETILVHAGAGGVGHVAVQLARHLGARVAATVSGDEKARLAADLGAELVIDYTREDFVERTLAWTAGAGADVVLDTVGGANFAQSFAAVRLYGRLATLMSTSCEMSQVNTARMRNLLIGYVQMSTPLLLGDQRLRRAQTRILERGAELFEQGRLRVVVSKVYPLAEVAEAHRHVEQGHASGKVVVEVA